MKFANALQIVARLRRVAPAVVADLATVAGDKDAVKLANTLIQENPADPEFLTNLEQLATKIANDLASRPAEPPVPQVGPAA